LKGTTDYQVMHTLFTRLYTTGVSKAVHCYFIVCAELTDKTHIEKFNHHPFFYSLLIYKMRIIFISDIMK